MHILAVKRFVPILSTPSGGGFQEVPVSGYLLFYLEVARTESWFIWKENLNFGTLFLIPWKSYFQMHQLYMNAGNRRCYKFPHIDYYIPRDIPHTHTHIHQ